MITREKLIQPELRQHVAGGASGLLVHTPSGWPGRLKRLQGLDDSGIRRGLDHGIGAS